MRKVLLLTLAASLLLPATALGATRYASPTGGTTGVCAASEPCSLEYAVTAAGSGDEVVVTAGTYAVATTIKAEVPLSIHGAAGQARPRIVGAPKVTPFELNKLATVSDLRIESTESGLGSLVAFESGDTFDHLELIASGELGLAFRPGVTWTMTDSLLVAKGPKAGAFFVQGVADGTAVMRNDTVIAEGTESIAVAITGVVPITAKIEATNVIAIGSIAAEARNNSGSSTSISFSHSDVQGEQIGAVTMTAGQAAPPLFVDAAEGNYREAPGSPTIGTGLYEPADGATDLGGNARAIAEPTCGPTANHLIDIGAFQYPIPVAVPPCVAPPPPQTKIVKEKIAGRNAKFRFAASGATATGFECKLDAKPWRECVSPKTYKHLKPGVHVFRVRAFGPDGVDPTPAMRKFRIRQRHG